MPLNTKPGVGGHKDQSLIIANATNVGSATFFAPRGVLSRRLMDILKRIYLIARDVASVLWNVPKMQ